MFTMKCRFAEIFSCTVGDNDFEYFKAEGIKGGAVYDWLDEMRYLIGGIVSNKFVFKIDDHLVIQTLQELEEHFDVRSRPVINLTEVGNDELQKLVIIENSKANYSDIEFSIEDTNRLSFEVQQVIMGGDWELKLLFLNIDNSLIDLSEEIILESFSGLVISKKLGYHEVDIE